MGKLTAKKVDALTEPGRYSDEDGTGFHVRVDAQRRKYFILRVQVDGKRKDITLGSTKKLTLSAARELARKKREQLDATGTIAAEVPTFAAAATSAHGARTAGFRNAKHVDQWLNTLTTYAFPVIGEKKVNEVERADVVAILTPIWLSKPETASRVLQRIDRVMRWAVGNDHRSDRIDMTLVRDALPPRKRRRADIRRMAAIPWKDMPAFWATLPTSRSAPEIRMGLATLILTAVRPGNIAKAKRRDVDLVGKVWAIPGVDMKSGESHRVPLSDAAVRILGTMMASHDRELLFAVGDDPISPDTLRMMMRRMGRSETPHGFRSSFKDWSRAAGWADDLSEIALAHADPNEVRAAYAREDQLDARRPMMQAWAQFLEAIPETHGDPRPAPASDDRA